MTHNIALTVFTGARPLRLVKGDRHPPGFAARKFLEEARARVARLGRAEAVGGEVALEQGLPRAGRAEETRARPAWLLVLAFAALRVSMAERRDGPREHGAEYLVLARGGVVGLVHQGVVEQGEEVVFRAQPPPAGQA